MNENSIFDTLDDQLKLDLHTPYYKSDKITKGSKRFRMKNYGPHAINEKRNTLTQTRRNRETEEEGKNDCVECIS